MTSSPNPAPKPTPTPIVVPLWLGQSFALDEASALLAAGEVPDVAPPGEAVTVTVVVAVAATAAPSGRKRLPGSK